MLRTLQSLGCYELLRQGYQGTSKSSNTCLLVYVHTCTYIQYVCMYSTNINEGPYEQIKNVRNYATKPNLDMHYNVCISHRSLYTA